MGTMDRSILRYFIGWLVIVPPGIAYVFMKFPPGEVNWLHVSVFALFGLLSIYFPIKQNGAPVFLIMWVTVPAFLMYGLFIEILIMQLAILAVNSSITRSVSFAQRFFFNSTLFFVLSVIGAFAFRTVGGEIGSLEFWPLLLGVIAYQLIRNIMKDILIKLYCHYKKIELRSGDFELITEYVTVFVLIPLSLSLYFLIEITGISAFILMGIPFFFILYISRLYRNSESINDLLRLAGDIGTQMSAMKKEQDVIDWFVIKVSELYNTDYTYLFDHDEEWLELTRSYEHRKFIDIETDLLAAGQGLVGSALEQNQPLIYSNRGEWEHISRSYAPSDMESVLCIPISRNQKIEAVLLLGSNKRAVFKDIQLKVLDLLCSYFTVSVEKARYMEETVTKSERCALTKLYNYRYLETKLNYEMNRLKNNVIKDLSVIMLDIDHFKNVNDTYGHQSGNDILQLLAEKLESALPPGGTVGRYGGEEFVFILSDMAKEKAVEFAEKLRLLISGHPFSIVSDLSEDQQPLTVRITSSIGVSSAPKDTDEALTLLRNADRALYIGAKQSGRNRVAEYVK